MNWCPVHTLASYLKQIRPTIKKPTTDTGFEVLEISKEELLQIFRSLNYAWELHEDEDDVHVSHLSETGILIYNYVMRACNEYRFPDKAAARHWYISAAILSLDVLFSAVVIESKTREAWIQQMILTKEMLRNHATFFPYAESAIRAEYPYRVDAIISQLQALPYIFKKDWKLCPAFPIMQEVSDALEPHYLRFWEKNNNRA